MKRSIALGALLSMLVSTTGQAHELCQGFVPENKMRIPVGLKTGGGITEAAFNEVLDKVQAQYEDEVKERGARLKINRKWNDGTVNASAQQLGSNWVINMYGGLARHRVITRDAFVLVACHEMGHHLGGAPKVKDFWGTSWASNEGQSDYYATLKCMRRLFAAEDNETIVAAMEIDPVAKSQCEANFAGRDEQLVCMRGAMAGKAAGLLFNDLRRESKLVSFDTPDQNVVSKIYDAHPGSQCRLDTYFSGAICKALVSEAVSDSNYRDGTCADATRFSDGLRPLCWFKPD